MASIAFPDKTQSMVRDPIIQAYCDAVARIKIAKLGLLAKAFVEEIGCPPSECELVEQTKDGVITYFFRKREPCGD